MAVLKASAFSARSDGRLRVLTLLCQKPGETGSGIVLKEMVDHADVSGAVFAVLCAAYDGDEPMRAFSRAPHACDTVQFNRDGPRSVPFPIVGMSNQMPYPSIPFKELTPARLKIYLGAWRAAIRSSIESHRPDVLHVHHLWLLAAVTAMEAGDRPIVVTVHGTDLFRAEECPHLAELIAPWVASFAEILALTPDSAVQVRRLYPEGPAKLSVLGNGFNEKVFYPPRGGELARSGICVSDATQVVLTVAQFDPRKCIDCSIRGFARAAIRTPERVILLVVGSGPARDLEKLREIARACGVEDRVLFLSAVSREDVGALMRLASILVLPSFREPFGLVLLEALACGCRVVATAHGGPPSFIPRELRESGDAILVPGLSSMPAPETEVERLVTHVADALAAQIARPLNARDRNRISGAVRHMTWGSYAARLGEIYRRLVIKRDV